MRHVIYTPEAPNPVGPYSQAIVATGTLLFTAGQIALDPTTGGMIEAGDVQSQTEQVFKNLQAVLAAGGVSFENVVKTTVFLADMADFAAMNQVYNRYFDPASAPARSCVQAARLPKDALVEIECIAVLTT